MASTIATIRTKVVGADGLTGRVQQTQARLTFTAGGDVDQCINSAREEYEKIRPLPLVVKLAGVGTFDFAINGTNFPGYVDLSSTITEIRYPYITTSPYSPRMDRRRWDVVRLDTGLVLRFYEYIAAGLYALVSYTGQHTLDASSSTIPVTDEEALADLAAAYALDMLANQYTQSVDATISADVDNRLSKAGEYRADAEKMRAKWRRKMGLDQAELPPRPAISTRPMRRS